MHLGRFQVIGLVGVALFVIGAVLGVVLPQLSPPIYSPFGLSWALYAAGGLLFWVGVIGGVVEVIAHPTRRPDAIRREAVPPLK